MKLYIKYMFIAMLIMIPIGLYMFNKTYDLFTSVFHIETKEERIANHKANVAVIKDKNNNLIKELHIEQNKTDTILTIQKDMLKEQVNNNKKVITIKQKLNDDNLSKNDVVPIKQHKKVTIHKIKQDTIATTKVHKEPSPNIKYKTILIPKNKKVFLVDEDKYIKEGENEIDAIYDMYNFTKDTK